MARKIINVARKIINVYMPNNGYIIYVDMLQLWIYLLFSYTTCEWSESEFHNKKGSVLLCSVQFSELVHV